MENHPIEERACNMADGIISEANSLILQATGEKERLSEETDFPLEILPTPIREIALEMWRGLSFPIDYVAVAMLTAVSAGVGSTIRAKFKEGFVSYCNIFAAAVGCPGANKTYPLKEVLKPIIEYDSPIAIVEDEKSAIVCSHFLPQYIWLSASSLDACVWKMTDLQFIANRQVVIFPSLCSYRQWKQISFLIAGKGIRCVVSDYIEHHANELERADGLGIADFLLKKVLAEKQTAHLKHLSPAEQLEKMKAENPAIQMLIDIFDLELVNTIEPPRRIKRQTEGACSDRD